MYLKIPQGLNPIEFADGPMPPCDGIRWLFHKIITEPGADGYARIRRVEMVRMLTGPEGSRAIRKLEEAGAIVTDRKRGLWAIGYKIGPLFAGRPVIEYRATDPRLLFGW